MKRLILLAVVVAGCGNPAPPAANPIRWQYDIYRTDDIPGPSIFNSHGDEGWELFQIIERKDGGYLFLYKRPKQ